MEPKKLNLGVKLYGIIELTMPIEGSIESNNTVPLDTTADIEYTVLGDAYYDAPTSYYYDVCAFKKVYYLKVGSCKAIRSESGPLNSSCTAKGGWNRVFNDNVKSTYLYKVHNTSVVVGSPNPLTTYYYITYEDFQSIQYKLKLITDKSYGGIAFDGMVDACGDMINAVESIFPLNGSIIPLGGSNPPSNGSGNSSGTDAKSIFIIIIVILIFSGCCGGGGKAYYNKRANKGSRENSQDLTPFRATQESVLVVASCTTVTSHTSHIVAR